MNCKKAESPLGTLRSMAKRSDTDFLRERSPQPSVIAASCFLAIYRFLWTCRLLTQRLLLIPPQERFPMENSVG